MSEDPISLEGLRNRIEYIRDHAVEQPDMTPRERGRISGARDMLTFVLTQISRVRCTCEPPQDEEPAQQGPLLRLLKDDERS